MKLNGAQILLECLKANGVDTVFGFPGGKVIPLYDELFKVQDSISHIMTADEQGAAHAADGYARVTGRTGVCIATSGPGATNLVTGIAGAYMDSIPMVAITGNVGTVWLGRDSFQEVDIVGMTMPVTKHNYQVRNVDDMQRIVNDAFYIAREGRPGPVLIDIPVNIFTAQTEYDPDRNHASKQKKAQETDLTEAIALISESKHPVIFAGGGVVKSNASAELLAFAEKLNAPVASSLMGLCGFPNDHELFTGMIGMHGTKASNMAVMNCDLLIVLGSRFSDRVVGMMDKFAPEAKILQIEIDPAEVNKNISTHYHIIGDVKEILQKLNALIQRANRKEWLDHISQWKAEDEKKQPAAHEGRIVISQIHELADRDAIIVTDVGQHQMWTAQYYNFCEDNTLCTSGGLGTMGYGLGAAIGAKFGAPGRQVFLVTGDGSFRMNLNEMSTVSCYNLPLVTVLLDNNTLGMVRQWQNMFFGKRYSSTDLCDLDFCTIAKGFGIKSWMVDDVRNFKNALSQAIEYGGPAFIHCKINTDTMVLPMVPPGESIDNLLMYEGEL